MHFDVFLEGEMKIQNKTYEYTESCLLQEQTSHWFDSTFLVVLLHYHPLNSSGPCFAYNPIELKALLLMPLCLYLT